MNARWLHKSLLAPAIFLSLVACGTSKDSGAGEGSASMPTPEPGNGSVMDPANPDTMTDGMIDGMSGGATEAPPGVSEEGVMPVLVGQVPPEVPEGGGMPTESEPPAEPEMPEPPVEEPEPEPVEEPPAEPPTCGVSPITDELRDAYDLDPFYTKFALASGVPVISSNAPADLALTRACELLIDMMSVRQDALQILIQRRTRFGIIGANELTNDIPEYRDFADTINTRARGLGGQDIGTCAEESILCDRQRDRWRGEGICVHEFSHTISAAALFRADPTFERRLRDSFQSAQDDGLFENTYALDSFQEYWAEGVQDWYNTNLESIPSNGIHNEIDKRAELETYDPTLYGLISEWLPDEPKFRDCYSDVD